MTAPLYDVAAALGEIRRWRDTWRDTADDPVAHAAIALGDELADSMRGHFPDPSDAATAGHAVMILAGALAALPPGIPPDAAHAVAALAGQRLVEGPVS